MEYRNLGNSGLKVSQIGLGTNNFGTRVNEADSISIINHAIELGINFIDTSNVYGGRHPGPMTNRGLTESYIGKAIKGKRSQVIIATKFWGAIGEGPNQHGTSRYHILEAIDKSLKRLGTDYIDLYYIHWPEPTTPIEETLRALDTLVRTGKVRYIGYCNPAAWELCDALWTSRVNLLEPFVVTQVGYNLLDKSIEKEMFPLCQKFGLGIVPAGPLAGGILSDNYQHQETPPPGSRLAVFPSYKRFLTESNLEKLDKLKAFSKECGHGLQEIAIAWLLSHDIVSSVIAGASRPEQVTANIEAGTWKISAEEIEVIEEITGKQPGRPSP